MQKQTQKDWSELSEKERREKLLQGLTGKVGTRELLENLTTAELEMASVKFGKLVGSVWQTVWQRFYENEETDVCDKATEKTESLFMPQYCYDHPFYEGFENRNKHLHEFFGEISQETLEYLPEIQKEVQSRNQVILQ